jgi:uncharacterized protein DUF541
MSASSRVKAQTIWQALALRTAVRGSHLVRELFISPWPLFRCKFIVSDKKFDPNERRNVAMAAFGLAVQTALRWILPVSTGIAVAALCVAAAQAQTAEPKSPAQARVIVVGEGSVTVAPDYARISSGVTTNAKTVKEPTDSNSKVMAAIIAALADAGIAKKDIQTSEFSVEPVYTSASSKLSNDAANAAPKLSGFRVSNQVNVTIHQIA